MSSFKTTVISATALVAVVQFCPAPFVPAIAEAVAVGFSTVGDVVSAAGTVAGTVQTVEDLTSKVRRFDDHLLAYRQTSTPDANQLAWQLCHEQLGSASLDFSSPAKGTVLAQGVPPACMTLSTVLTGTFNEGDPVPMGSDSIQFSNLTDDTINEIEDALTAKKGSSA